jgi:hypothetical protein
MRLARPVSGPNADVVINPKKSLLTVDFTVVVNEVSRAFVVIEEKLAAKTGTVGGTQQKSSVRPMPKA